MKAAVGIALRVVEIAFEFLFRNLAKRLNRRRRI